MHDGPEVEEHVTRDLRRITARAGAAMTRAARLAGGLPEAIEVVVGEIGSVAMRRLGVEPLEAAPAALAGDVVLGISGGVEPGRLVVDGGLAHGIVALALGGARRPGAPLGRLGPAERGVVAGVVASALYAMRAPFSVSLDAPDAAALAPGGAAVALAVEVTGARGWARVELPGAWLAGAPPPPGAELVALEVEARLELAATSLAAGEVAALAPGDAVVFDGEPPFVPSGARAVRVVVGARAARARLGADGRVTLEDALRRVPITREVTMSSPSSNSSKEGSSTADVTAALAATPIEVVAEIGRLTLRGEEVIGLGPGAVLAFGRPGAAAVALRVGGEIWAEGELVDVDGALGVRVTATRRSG
jgi:type III secretion protein Q